MRVVEKKMEKTTKAGWKIWKKVRSCRFVRFFWKQLAEGDILDEIYRHQMKRILKIEDWLVVID